MLLPPQSHKDSPSGIPARFVGTRRPAASPAAPPRGPSSLGRCRTCLDALDLIARLLDADLFIGKQIKPFLFNTKAKTTNCHRTSQYHT